MTFNDRLQRLLDQPLAAKLRPLLAEIGRQARDGDQEGASERLRKVEEALAERQRSIDEERAAKERAEEEERRAAVEAAEQERAVLEGAYELAKMLGPDGGPIVAPIRDAIAAKDFDGAARQIDKVTTVLAEKAAQLAERSVQMVWSGEWLRATNYPAGSVVDHDSAIYVAIQRTSSEPPSEDWDLIVKAPAIIVGGGGGIGARGPAGPPGPPGTGVGTLIREDAIGPIDGANLTFLSSETFVSGSTLVYYNGLLQQFPDDYAETGTTQITMVEAPEVGDRLVLVYARSD